MHDAYRYQYLLPFPDIDFINYKDVMAKELNDAIQTEYQEAFECMVGSTKTKDIVNKAGVSIFDTEVN